MDFMGPFLASLAVWTGRSALCSRPPSADAEGFRCMEKHGNVWELYYVLSLSVVHFYSVRVSTLIADDHRLSLVGINSLTNHQCE